MSGRGGGGARDRIRGREFTSRFEEKPRGNAQTPSRHLWIGNLHHGIDEGELADQFLQFGELESVVFQPGRSYAFINFRNDDDAIAAMRALKGFPLAGNPLRIEFAKADKLSASPHDEDYVQRRGDQHSAVRGSPFSQRDSRARHASPDHFHPEEPKTSGKDGEPSEVLWIGFPALLKVDEATLRKAFSPFGVIEKISIFPGRSYAFVRFRNVMSACRAKETLQGKLLGNPRVHICFAKSETGSSNSARNSMNIFSPPPYKPNGRLGPADGFREDMDFGSLAGDPRMRSRFNSDLDPEDSDSYRFNRRGSQRADGDDGFEPWRYTEMGSELEPAQDFYDHHYRSPKREREASSRDFPQKFSRKGSVYEEEQWDLPEDPYFSDRSKRLKTSSFPPERELPEYLFSDREEERHAYPRQFPDSPQLEVFDRNFEAGPHGYKQTPDRPTNLTITRGQRSDQWRGSSYDGFQVGSGSLPPKPVESKRFTPESNCSSLRDWKWEGTIAKGGTPVCHARCLPVGKVMDIMLPEFLDCTARTGLDMLAKHYYQAAASWVVFFTPCSDADIGLYNEFMHYLEEKQRAAVAKLDDSTTLFLVPPSDFSEQVLRVPGRLSISGVVLRLEQPGSDLGYLPQPIEANDRNLLAYHPDTSYPKRSSPASFSGSDPHSGRNLPDSYNNSRHEYHPQNPISATRNMQSQNSNSTVGHSVHEHPGRMPIANLQPEQLAHLVSLLGQQRQSTGTDSRQGNTMNQPDNASGTTPHRYPLHDNQVSSEISNYQFGQVQQQQQQPMIERELQSVSQVSQQMQSNSTRDEADTDPQKRLQATLQLAAALLQQIRQGKGT